MTLNFEVDTDASAPLIAHMLHTSVPDGVTIQVEPFREGRSGAEIPVVLVCVLTFGANVAASVIANWLYDTLHKHPPVLRIERTKVTFNKGAIEKVIVEKIEKR
jgi:hypothetical protein